MFGWIGDKSIGWRIWLYTDADSAADKSTSKSVSAVFCAIHGPTSHPHPRVLSKQKGAVSHSTAESEMVAADLGLRTEAFPLTTLFDAVLKSQIRCLLLEDYQATLRIITTGQHQALRHVLRTHRVNVHWVSQVCREQPIYLGACESHRMVGDMFTKFLGFLRNCMRSRN